MMSWFAFYCATASLILGMGVLYRNTVVADRRLAADRKRLSAYQIAKMEHEALPANTDWNHGRECPKCRPRPKPPLPDPTIRRDKLNKRRRQIQIGGDGARQVQVGGDLYDYTTADLNMDCPHMYLLSSGKCIMCGERASL